MAARDKLISLRMASMSRRDVVQHSIFSGLGKLEVQVQRMGRKSVKGGLIGVKFGGVDQGQMLKLRQGWDLHGLALKGEIQVKFMPFRTPGVDVDGEGDGVFHCAPKV